MRNTPRMDKNPATEERKMVRGLSRGLEVLRVLNDCPDASAAHLSARTGLPRATVHRLLDTLCAEGYVAHNPESHTYKPTISCRQLSDGYYDELWMLDIAVPVIEELGRELLWPVDIATRHEDRMVIRATTHRFSPLSFHRGRVGWRIPLLATSLGITYLAFCPDTEARMILRALYTDTSDHVRFRPGRDRLDHILREIRKQGYGIRNGGLVPETGSFAVPVADGSRCIATINIQYMLSAMSTQEALEQYLAPLKSAAARIESALSSADRTTASTR